MDNENNNNKAPMIEKLKNTLKEKGDSIKPNDLLIPEIQWIIDCTPLSAVDRRFAELRYIQGHKSSYVIEQLNWYSTKTFTNHNKKVWATLVQTLHKLVD